MAFERVNALVLAGGAADAVAAQQPGTANKAFVEIGGMTLVARTIAGLRAARSVERIVVVAPSGTHAHPALRDADERRPDGAHISESLRSGLASTDPDRAVLVCASDMPVLDGVTVDDFCARIEALDADAVYGCVERRVHLARYPEIPHTWARMRDGVYCGGGMVGLKPRVLPSLLEFIERLGAARKAPLRLAGLFGWDVLLRFALRRLSIAQAEARASELLGAPVRAAISPYPESAVNVDRVGDIALAERLVAARSQ